MNSCSNVDLHNKLLEYPIRRGRVVIACSYLVSCSFLLKKNSASTYFFIFDENYFSLNCDQFGPKKHEVRVQLAFLLSWLNLLNFFQKSSGEVWIALSTFSTIIQSSHDSIVSLPLPNFAMIHINDEINQASIIRYFAVVSRHLRRWKYEKVNPISRAAINWMETKKKLRTSMVCFSSTLTL